MGAMAGLAVLEPVPPFLWSELGLTCSCRSNFGIVTKAGVWLYPEPEEVLSLDMELANEGDIGWVVETLAPLSHERGASRGRSTSAISCAS